MAVACSGGSERDLEEAEELWTTSGVPSYNLVIRLTCLCPPDVSGPFAVTVRNGEVVEVRVDGAVIEPQAGVTPIEAFTVEGLFGIVKEHLDDDEIMVSYGEQGNPTVIDIDEDFDVVDDEWRITAVLTAP